MRLASTYRSIERNGIFTPDENIIDNSTHSLDVLKGFLDVSEVQNNLYISFKDVNFGEKSMDGVIFDRRHEDGLVLCLSNSESAFRARKMKKVACVRIYDVKALKRIIDGQLGKKSIAGDCEYTTGHRRGHFLKSTADSWQKEYRMFWKHDRNVEITLPPGIATLVGVLPRTFRVPKYYRYLPIRY